MAKVKLKGGTPLPPEALDVLRTADIGEKTVRLTCGQLDRDLYELVDEFLKRLGGKWKGGRTSAHVFEIDPRGVMAYWLGTGTMPPDNPEAFYETPPAVVERVMELAMDAFPYHGDTPRILEPSAGKGALLAAALDYWPDAQAVAVELDAARARTCLKVRFPDPERVRVVEHDFLTLKPALLGTFDLVLMNPPFAVDGRPDAWLDHVEHARTFLRGEGARLVAVTPATIGYGSKKKIAAFRAFVEEHGGHAALPPQSFREAGTGVSTAVLYLNGPEGAEAAPAPAPAPARRPAPPGPSPVPGGPATDMMEAAAEAHPPGRGPDPDDDRVAFLSSNYPDAAGYLHALDMATPAEVAEAMRLLEGKVGHWGYAGTALAFLRKHLGLKPTDDPPAPPRSDRDRDLSILKNVPAGDVNFAGALGRADAAMLREALAAVEGRAGHKSRTQAIRRRLKTLEAPPKAARAPREDPGPVPVGRTVRILKYRGKLVFPGDYPGAVVAGEVTLPESWSPVIVASENTLYPRPGERDGGFKPGGLLVAAKARMFGVRMAEAE